MDSCNVLVTIPLYPLQLEYWLLCGDLIFRPNELYSLIGRGRGSSGIGCAGGADEEVRWLERSGLDINGDICERYHLFHALNHPS